MEKTKEFKEYIDAATKMVQHVVFHESCKTWDEFEYLEDTLIELLERHNDVCKPRAEQEARRR